MDNNGITGIAFSTIDNQVAEENGVYYHDYSAMIGDVTAGATESIDITYETDYGYKTYIWIDWNDDFDFDDPDEEQLLGENPDTTNPETITFTFNVPATATAGNHRMRIGGADSGMNTTGNPCYTGTYGEFEDYTVNVVIPSCFNPGSLNTSSITATSTNLSWTDTNSSSETYLVEWRIVGDPAFTNFTTAVGASTYPLAGLTSQTEYEWQITSSCGGITVSGANFTTLCAIFTAPYTQDFENTGTIPACWSQGESNSEDWNFSNTYSGNHIGNNGTVGNTSASDGYFAWIQDSTPDNTGTTLETPFVDVSGLTTPIISFYLLSHNEGSVSVDFSIDVWDGAVWNVGVFTSNTNTADWEQKFVDLSGLTITGPIQARFIVDEPSGATYEDDLAIDDVSFEEAPSCFPASSLVVSGVTSAVADFTWSDTNGGTETYIVEWRIVGDPTFTSFTTSVGATTHQVTMLTAETDYEWQVTSGCTAATVSGANFVTLCDATTYFTENFDSVSTPNISDCWSKIENSTTTTASVTTNITSDVSLPNSIRFYNGNDASAELLLITPQLSDAINTGRIKFSGRDNDSNDLLIGTVTDPTDASTFTLHETVSLTTTHTVYTINFDTYAGTDNFIAFKMSPGATYDYTYIDDFVWEAIPSCLEPSSLTVDTETSLGANLGWSENNSPAETEWDLYIVATGSTAPNAVTVPTINDATTSAYTWIGGTGNTTYDFYVRTDCGADNTDVSTWTGPVTFTTLCDSITTFPWTEDFESITAGQPDCWGIDGTTSTSTYHWYSYGTGETGRGMRFNSYLNTSGRTSELTTQTLDVTSLTVPQLKFHYKNPTAGNFEVLISSDGGSTFTSLESSLTGQTAWLEKTYDISVYSSANVIIKFFATSNYGNGDAYVYLDNVTIEEAPCPGGTTTWTGTSAAGSWDNGTPTVTMVAVIDGEYITSTNGDIDACSLNITSANGDLTVSANDYVKIENNINNDGLFLVESQGSVVQVDDLAVVTGDSSGFDVEVKTTVLADSDRFTYFSSPSVGNALDVFTWANQVYMWSFDGATQNWQYEAAPASTMMNPGQGYTVQDDVNTGADVETTNFSGAFNNGVITQPMYNAVVGAPDPMDNSSTLVGNPYPSAIESNKLFTENAQLGGIYIWNHDSALGAGYGDWANNDYIACAAGNACTSAPSAGTNAAHTGFIATGQGFFAISNTPSPSDLVFNNDMRVTDNNTQFRTQDEDRMWINLSDNTVGYYSQALFRFTSNGDENLNNQYDALLLGSNYGLGFYSITSDTNDRLAIEDRGIFTDDITIPVGYTVNNPAVTELTFDIDHFQGLEGVNVYVKDNLLNILHDLKVANYTFNVAAVGEVNDRFEILFSRSALATNEVVIVNDDLVVSNQNDSQVQVNMLDGSIITNIKAFDTLGKLIIDIDSNSNSFVINTTLKQGQVVFVKATLENGQVLNKKFIKL